MDHDMLDQLFRDARSYKFFEDRPVDDEILDQLYELACMAPTSQNCCPMRIVFAKSEEAKNKVIAALAPGNVAKTKSAPVTAIVAYDLKFYVWFPKLAPYIEDPAGYSRMSEKFITDTVMRNSSIQGAFLILAARAVGLDCGPMSGFSNDKIDELFFSGTSWRSNFLINLGYGTQEGLHPRAERLNFDEACTIA